MPDAILEEQKKHAEVLEAQGKAFEEMKQIISRLGTDSSEAKEALSKVDAEFEKLEKNNDDLLKAFESRKEAEEKMAERIDDLEKELSRPGAGKDENAEAKAEMKALNLYVRKGIELMQQEDPEEVKRLRTDSNIDGGYLVEPEFVREILKDITEISPIRSVARVRQTQRKTVMVPTRTKRVSSGWNGEGTEAIRDNSQYGLEEMTMGKLSVQTIITNEELSDASFNMEVEIRDDVSEEFARAEGQAFVSGDGVNKPEGFLINPDVESFDSASVGQLGADDLIDITGELKTGYDPRFLLNRRTLAYIRKLKDGEGQYLWAPGIAAGLPNTIIGEPYVSVIDMPDVAAGQTPVAYGDFRRGYWIVDRTMMTMVRDPYTRARTDEVVVTFHRRLTGQVVKPEAIKKILIQS